MNGTHYKDILYVSVGPDICGPHTSFFPTFLNAVPTDVIVSFSLACRTDPLIDDPLFMLYHHNSAN